MKKSKLKKEEVVENSNLKRSQLVEFTVKYNGKAVESNEMDANELATSLLGISNVLEEANSIVNVSDSKLFIKVRGSFKPGSFYVDLSSFYQTGFIQTVFNNGDNIKIAASVATLVGFVHWTGSGIINSLIGLCRVTKGKKILSKEPVGNHISKINVEDCENPFIVNNLVINLYEDQRERQELERAVSPLNNEGISDMTFIVDGKEQEKILREERDSFSYTKTETIEEKEEIEHFYITQANFDGKQTGWRLSFGDSSISQNKSNDFSVKILDEKFLNKVLTRKLIISSDGTAIIKARYKKITHISGKLTVNWEILEVLETDSPEKNYVNLDNF
jgi:phage terminase small subunit